MLRELGVEVVTNTRVSQIDEIGVLMKGPSGEQSLAAHTVLWAAGAVFGDILAERTQAERTGGVRLVVDASLALAGYPDSFVIGDLAAVTDRRAKPVPGLASAAIQQSEYVACVLKRRRQENRHRGSSTRTRAAWPSSAVRGQSAGLHDRRCQRLATLGCSPYLCADRQRTPIARDAAVGMEILHLLHGDRPITGRLPNTRRLHETGGKQRH
mgnify:CR=1 FL=1